MTEGRDAPRRPGRAPMRPRSRKRWMIVGGVAACWVVLELATGSALVATVLLVAVAGLGAATVAGLRTMGITREHPWIQQMASRPWRDGEDVLQVAMRHLSDVFVITPSGSLFAPNAVELRLNPDDLYSLRERMEVDVIGDSLTEVYEEQVAARGARFAGPDRPEVYVVADESIPPGRYRLRQGHPVTVGAPPDIPEVQYAEAAVSPPEAAVEHSLQFETWSHAWHEEVPAQAVGDGRITVMEQKLPPVPMLRLITGSSVAQTLMSGARAGRGSVEMVLPDVPTISREHAKFTFQDGRWWVTNMGVNGLTLNGAPVTGEQPLSDGDEIRWGRSRDALPSRVEIG
ncbi:MAG TPA: FHA domain-containing protein [Streptosporangiaceae bacterium]